MVKDKMLWQPTAVDIQQSEIATFAAYVAAQTGFDWGGDFQSLWRWSTSSMEAFWTCVWQWHGIIGDMGHRPLVDADKMPGAVFS